MIEQIFQKVDTLSVILNIDPFHRTSWISSHLLFYSLNYRNKYIEKIDVKKCHAYLHIKRYPDDFFEENISQHYVYVGTNDVHKTDRESSKNCSLIITKKEMFILSKKTARIEHLDLIKFLYQNNKITSEFDELRYAIEFGHLEVIKFLLSKGFKTTTNHVNVAICNYDFKIVKILYENWTKNKKDVIFFYGVAKMYKCNDTVEFFAIECEKLID